MSERENLMMIYFDKKKLIFREYIDIYSIEEEENENR